MTARKWAQKVDAAKVASTERRNYIMAQRSKNRTMQDIADELGVTRQYVGAVIKRENAK